jgi:hypothetical protein
METFDEYSDMLAKSIAGRAAAPGFSEASAAQIFVFLGDEAAEGAPYVRETLSSKWRNASSCAFVRLSTGPSEGGSVGLGASANQERGDMPASFMADRKALVRVNEAFSDAVESCLHSVFADARSIVCSFVVAADSPVASLLADVCAILRSRLAPYSHIVFRLAAHFSDLEPTEKAYAFFAELSHMQGGAFEYHRQAVYNASMGLFAQADHSGWKVFDDVYLCGSVSEANAAIQRPFESMCRAFALSACLRYSEKKSFEYRQVSSESFRFSTFAYCRLEKPLPLISRFLLSEAYRLAFDAGRLGPEEIELPIASEEAIERAVDSVDFPPLSSMAHLAMEGLDMARARVMRTSEALAYLFAGLDERFFRDNFEKPGEIAVEKSSPSRDSVAQELFAMVESGETSFSSAYGFLQGAGPRKASDRIDSLKYQIASLEKELANALFEPTRVSRRIGEPFALTYAKAATGAVYGLKLQIAKKRLAISYLRNAAEAMEGASLRMASLRSRSAACEKRLKEATAAYLAKTKDSLCEGYERYYEGLARSIVSSYSASLPEGAPLFFSNGLIPPLAEACASPSGALEEPFFRFAVETLFTPRYDREGGLSLPFDQELSKRAEAGGALPSYAKRALEIIRRSAQPALRSVRAHPKRSWSFLVGNPESELFLGVARELPEAYIVEEPGRADGFEALSIEEGFAFEELVPYFESFTPSVLARMASLRLHAQAVPALFGDRAEGERGAHG